MYRQPNHSYTSTDSLRRLSSNNPFRVQQQQQQQAKYIAPQQSNRSNNSVSSPSNFDDWVEKNKQLIEISSDEDEPYRTVDMSLNLKDTTKNNSGDLARPVFPHKPVRADSDSSVNYGRKMSSNNPFAAALNEPDSYVHHRDPPPPPRTTSHSITPPARPPKPEVLAPPSYEEVADRKSREYPKEKESSGSSSSSGRHHTSSRQHRSHSDSRPHRSSREKTSTSSSSKPHRRHKSPTKKKSEPVKAKNLDTIDKLDVTGFFGGGFHHDGPFDACRPHRNKNVKAAPVMAFPIDGPNNSIKGLSGNVDKNEQMNLAFGNYSGEQNEVLGRAGSVKRANGASPLKSGDEGGLIKTNRIGADPAASYTPSHNPGVVNFDSNVKAEPVHGVVTAGLGSSTFIDGAPAPKAALNDEFLNVNNGGLGRKKSLVSRLRRNSNSENNSRRNSNDSGPAPESGRRGSLNNVQFDEEPVHESGGASSLLRRVKSLKVRK